MRNGSGERRRLGVVTTGEVATISCGCGPYKDGIGPGRELCLAERPSDPSPRYQDSQNGRVSNRPDRRVGSGLVCACCQKFALTSVRELNSPVAKVPQVSWCERRESFALCKFRISGG
jgi:hypothetical protein